VFFSSFFDIFVVNFVEKLIFFLTILVVLNFCFLVCENGCSCLILVLFLYEDLCEDLNLHICMILCCRLGGYVS